MRHRENKVRKEYGKRSHKDSKVKTVWNTKQIQWEPRDMEQRK